MSQTDGETTVINGVTYRVRMLPIRESLKMGHKILSIIGPSIGALSGADREALASKFDSKKALSKEEYGADKSASTSKAFQEAITLFLDRLDFDEGFEILQQLATVTEVKMDKGWPTLSQIFDIHFHGKLKELYQWASFALGVQCGSFLRDMVSAINPDDPT